MQPKTTGTASAGRPFFALDHLRRRNLFCADSFCWRYNFHRGDLKRI